MNQNKSSKNQKTDLIIKIKNMKKTFNLSFNIFLD